MEEVDWKFSEVAWQKLTQAEQCLVQVDSDESKNETTLNFFDFKKYLFQIKWVTLAKNPGGEVNHDEKSGVPHKNQSNPGFFVAVYPPPDFLPEVNFRKNKFLF